ncbi:MAG: signal peptidase I [Nanobdellota archaeon]
MIKLRPVWKILTFILVGVFIGLSLKLPHSYEIPMTDGFNTEKKSPTDRIKQDQIKVTDNEVILKIKNASWSKFADTNSMDPLLDKGANAIQEKPVKNELNEGDIISYRPKGKNYLVIHRIIEIGDDGEWYAIVKGDNNKYPDKGKIRFNQIEKVLLAIIY